MAACNLDGLVLVDGGQGEELGDDALRRLRVDRGAHEHDAVAQKGRHQVGGAQGREHHGGHGGRLGARRTRLHWAAVWQGIEEWNGHSEGSIDWA